MKKIIAYYRSSKKEQHYSIEVQREQMLEFVKKYNHELIAEYYEHQSGKDNSRIELAKAIAHCVENRLTLGFTKLDRISRRASFLHQIKDTELDLVCVDMPELNTLTFGIFATIAQHERELISTRTKAALSIVRKTKKLGNPYGFELNKEKAIQTKIKMRKDWLAGEEVSRAKKLISLLRSSGSVSLNEICKNLNLHKIKTQRGKQWQVNQVKKLICEIQVK
jgi:DNA invertase Pin-like site-specific DNA recombinase